MNVLPVASFSECIFYALSVGDLCNNDEYIAMVAERYIHQERTLHRY